MRTSSLALIGLFACSVFAAAGELEVDDAEQAALALAAPIAACIVKDDTAHPVFHGCIDWHSSVHATWALTAYTRATGDPRYLALLDRYLDEDRLILTRRLMERAPQFEMPYGRAWFLLLASEFDRTVDDRLMRLGDTLAESLVAHYTDEAPEPFSRAYGNSAWALANLLHYGRYRGRADWIEFVGRQVEEHFLSGDECPLHREGAEFMAICLNWMWLVAEVLPEAQFRTWHESFAASFVDDLRPITQPRTSHEHGMNFSRCWGLWVMYEKTRDVRYRDLYLTHFRATYERREHWDGDYGQVAHWVAQFGMRALLAPVVHGGQDLPRR